MKIGPFEVVDDAPELKDTRAIAILKPWVNVGRVGTIVLTSLERHLGAQELGRFSRPGTFFNFTMYRPRMRIVEGTRVLNVPNCIVSYARDEDTQMDFMFLNLREPHAMAEEYVEGVVELMEHFNVVEYCRVGGFYDAVPHTRPIKVSGTLTERNQELTKDLVTVSRSTYQGPTSIVNLVGDGITNAGAANTSLMAHVPQYAQLDEDYLGAARLLQVLCAMYGFPSSLADTARGEAQYRQIDKLVANNPQIAEVIKRLESEYDGLEAIRDTMAQEEKPPTPDLSPEVERFLLEMGGKLEEQPEEE